MATLANFLQQAQAIGYWQEIPHGAQVGSGGGALASVGARFPMAERYSGVRHQVAGRVQLGCLAIFFDMAKRAIPTPLPDRWSSDVLTWAMLERVRWPVCFGVWAPSWGLRESPWFSAEVRLSSSSRR